MPVLREGGTRGSGGSQNRKRIGDLEPPAAKSIESSRTAAARARRTPCTGRLDHCASDENPLEVRRGDRVRERGGVEIAELRERELVRREREADVRVRELRPQPLAAREDDRAVVERERRQAIGRLPRCVGREPGVEFARDEPEIGSRKLPLTWHAFWIAQCSELLEMRELAHVHFRGELTADRLLESLAGLQSSAWK